MGLERTERSECVSSHSTTDTRDKLLQEVQQYNRQSNCDVKVDNQPPGPNERLAPKGPKEHNIQPNGEFQARKGADLTKDIYTNPSELYKSAPAVKVAQLYPTETANPQPGSITLEPYQGGQAYVFHMAKPATPTPLPTDIKVQ